MMRFCFPGGEIKKEKATGSLASDAALTLSIQVPDYDTWLVENIVVYNGAGGDRVVEVYVYDGTDFVAYLGKNTVPAGSRVPFPNNSGDVYNAQDQMPVLVKAGWYIRAYFHAATNSGSCSLVLNTRQLHIKI